MSVNVNLHAIFHDYLNEYDRFEFLKAEVAKLPMQRQASLVVESFGDLQDYFDINKMSVEIFKDDGMAVTTYER